MRSLVEEFQGEYRFLSNFWPCKINLDGIIYPTVEHFYQASKFIETRIQWEILKAESPGQAKREAKKYPIRKDWEVIKLETMKLGVLNKFSQNSDLRERLLETGEAYLCEGNLWHDNFWGICRCRNCYNKVRIGELDTPLNHLGEILMSIRFFLETWK